MIRRRVEFLTGYQNAAYAAKYRAAGGAGAPGGSRQRRKGLSGLAEAVARYYFKLLAYKDEYEVARLYADPAFMEKVKAQFEGDYKLHFHLAPPLLSKRDEKGELSKARVRPVDVAVPSRCWRSCAVLRGTALDIFGYTEERRTERQLILDYERDRRGTPGQAYARQPCAGGADRLDPGGDPRLRPREGPPPRGSEGEGGEARSKPGARRWRRGRQPS